MQSLLWAKCGACPQGGGLPALCSDQQPWIGACLPDIGWEWQGWWSTIGATSQSNFHGGRTPPWPMHSRYFWYRGLTCKARLSCPKGHFWSPVCTVCKGPRLNPYQAMLPSHCSWPSCRTAAVRRHDDLDLDGTTNLPSRFPKKAKLITLCHPSYTVGKVGNLPGLAACI